MYGKVDDLSHVFLTHVSFCIADLDFVKVLMDAQPHAGCRAALEEFREDLSKISDLSLAAWRDIFSVRQAERFLGTPLEWNLGP